MTSSFATDGDSDHESFSDDELEEDLAAKKKSGSATEMTLRPRHDIAALLDGLEVVEPGLVDLTDWPTPDPDATPAGGYAAISRIR